MPLPADNPDNTAPPIQAQPVRRWTPGKLAIQLVGLALGAALFTWAIRNAFKPENQPAIEKLKHAAGSDIALLLGLTIFSLILNGVVFWLTLRPLRRVPLGETIAINCIAAFLTLLPFKLGLLLRALIHYKRHAVPAKELAAWLAAFGGLSAMTLVVLAGASFWRGGFDGVWFGVVAAGLAVGGGLVILAGHLALKSALLTRLSLGADVIARDWRVVFGHIAMRVVDVATFGLRFWVAAKITGISVSPTGSMLMGSTYLLLNASAPAGSLGLAEAGTAFLAERVGVEKQQAVLLALVITAALSLTSGALALAAWAWLRPDKLMGSAGAQPSQPTQG